MSDVSDNRSRSRSARRRGRSRQRNLSISTKGRNGPHIELGRNRSRRGGEERIMTSSSSPNRTPTTSTPPDKSRSSAQRQFPTGQLWDSPFVPSKKGEWPDEKSKKYWIGPFDRSYDYYAKEAREADRREDENICNIRKLAEHLYDVGDFAGARYAWAQIADHYISEHQHISRWASGIDFKMVWNKQRALNHIARASIGGVLNTYFAQHPDLCAAINTDDESCSSSNIKPHPVFIAVVEYEDDLTNSHALYILRVMLDYASVIAYGKDHSWMRTIYKKALDTTAQIKGMDVSETIRLRHGLVREIVESERKAYWDGVHSTRSENWGSLSNGQREAHRIKSSRIWKDEVEELYLHNIVDQQTLFGATADATIGSELELVSHYKYVGDTEKAKANARQIYTLTKYHLGEDHDSTFRCLASLSTLLLDTGSVEEAGLVVHDCLTKHPGILSGSTDILSLELREPFITRRGWKEMMVVRSKLETLMSPFHFIWGDHRLYTLRTGTVTFTPSCPTDAEKENVWALASQEPNYKEDEKEDYSDEEGYVIIRERLRQQPRASPRSRADVERFAFSASERDHEFLDLQVPYIPYQHFMTTSAFEAGMPYLEYIKVTEDRSISSLIYQEAATDTPIRLGEYLKELDSRARHCNGSNEDAEMVEKQAHDKSSQLSDRTSSKECVEVEFDENSTTTQIQGFFNNIPSEAYISPELHVDLVSAQWADYQHFTLHQLPDKGTEIEIAEGMSLPCYGYISGTWTDFDVSQQRKVFEVFVVDASFIPSEVHSAMPMFALRQETLQSPRYHEVTNAEKRAFCARLNPSFYLYKLVRLLRPCAVYKRKMAKGILLTNTDELTLWEEMNAREKWDREFETRKPTEDADRAVLAQDLKAEEERRNVWDEEHKKKGKSEKESSSDLSMAASVSEREDIMEILSVPTSSSLEAEGKMKREADGRGFVGKFRRLRLRRTKDEARVASDVC